MHIYKVIVRSKGWSIGGAGPFFIVAQSYAEVEEVLLKKNEHIYSIEQLGDVQFATEKEKS